MRDNMKFAFFVKLLEDALRPIARTIVDDYYNLYAPDERQYLRKVTIRDLIDMIWCMIFELPDEGWRAELEEFDIGIKDGKDK